MTIEKQAYKTIEEKLEEIMRQRGFTSSYAFSASLGYSSKWYAVFMRDRAAGKSIKHSTVCNIAERLRAVPAIIHRADADRTPLFGGSEKHFREPIDYVYLRLAYVGDVIQLARIEKGISQRAFAKLVNLNHIHISSYENYRYAPKINHLQAICKALDLEVEWLANSIAQSA